MDITNPIWVELKNLKSRMDALYGRSFPAVPAEESPVPSPEDAAWQPFVDIWETEAEWVVAADLPGVEEADMQVQILNGELSLSGKRQTFGRPDEFSISQVERPEGRFHRSFVLPEKVRQEDVQAELKHGVLTIRVPKAKDDALPHKIKVQPE